VRGAGAAVGRVARQVDAHTAAADLTGDGTRRVGRVDDVLRRVVRVADRDVIRRHVDRAVGPSGSVRKRAPDRRAQDEGDGEAIRSWHRDHCHTTRRKTEHSADGGIDDRSTPTS
jgi:hypothetical protein